MRSLQLLPSSLLSFLLASTTFASSALDFSSFPTDAQTCLYQASNSSGCSTDSCLCSNGGDFVTNVAACLEESDPYDAVDVFDDLRDACSDASTPLNVKESVFLASAGISDTATLTRSATSTISSADATVVAISSGSTVSSSAGSATNTNATPTTTAGANEAESNPGVGLSTGAKAGIIAGGAIAGVVATAVVLWACMRYRRRKVGEESHPMLEPKNRPTSALPTFDEVNALEQASHRSSVVPEGAFLDASSAEQSKLLRDDSRNTSRETSPLRGSSLGPEVQIEPDGDLVDEEASFVARPAGYLSWETPEPTWGLNRPPSQRSRHWKTPPPSAHSTLSTMQVSAQSSLDPIRTGPTPSRSPSMRSDWTVPGGRAYEMAGSDPAPEELPPLLIPTIPVLTLTEGTPIRTSPIHRFGEGSPGPR